MLRAAIAAAAEVATAKPKIIVHISQRGSLLKAAYHFS